MHDLLKGLADLVGGHPLAVFRFDDPKELLGGAAVALLHALANGGVLAAEGLGLNGELGGLLSGEIEVHAWDDVLQGTVDVGV